MIASNPKTHNHVVSVDETKSAEPRKIQSLDVGFRIVRAIEESPEPLHLREIAPRVAMPRSKVHLYLSTFVSLGLIARDALGRYTLGPYALQLGLAVLNRSSIVEVSAAPLRDLQQATGHSVHLAIWGNQGPTIIKKLDGNQMLPVTVRVGFVMPLLTSATGRVYLTYYPQALLAPHLLRERQNQAITEKALSRLTDEVKRQGYATSDGGVYEGFSALSAPVFNHANELTAAVALLDSASRLGDKHRQASAERLKDTTHQIETLLGRTEGKHDRPS